jgi:hypothetical protein
MSPGVFFVPLAGLLVLVWWLIKDRKRFPIWFSVIAIVTVVGGFFAVPMFIESGGLGFLLTMIFGFGLSILVEGLVASAILDRSDIWKTVLVANLLSYLMMAFVAAGHVNAIAYEHSPRGAAWESRAKGTLRSIGSSELSYQSGNMQKNYGTFQALVRSQDIARGYTKSNMIESYSMTWSVFSSPIPQNVAVTGEPIKAFTVIAWPARGYGYLHTFAITEDMVVREYNPSDHSRLDSVKTWDPIL